MKFRRFFALLLVLCMALSLLPPKVSAATFSGQCGDDLFYVCFNGSRSVVISGTGDMYDYDYSSQMYTDPDGFVPGWSFMISNVAIREGVTSIGKNAFSCRDFLRKITIPKSVVSIGDSAFSSCFELKNVYYAGTEEEWAQIAIGSNNSYLTKATIHCNYTDPDVVDSNRCGENATWSFDEVTGILSISGTGAMYDYADTVLAPWPQARITGITFDPGITYIGANTFRYIENMPVLRIPDSITAIGENAFFGCTGLWDVTLPSGLTSIADGTFHYCSALTGISLPQSLTEIGQDAFSYSGLTKIAIPDSVTTIGKAAFTSCANLCHIILPAGLTAIGDSVFSNCESLTSVAIPEGVTTIGDSAFRACCGLSDVTLPDGLITIGARSFSHCSALTDITIPDSVTTLGDFALSGTGLTQIVIPEQVTEINYCTFADCGKLADITFPEGITVIGKSAFQNCTSLKSIALPARLYRIGEWAFSASGLTNVTLPDGVNTIDKYAFYGCTDLAEITFSDSVSSIGDSAFVGCTALTSVTLPGQVRVISKSMFSGCTSLADVILPYRLTRIGECAFENTALGNITLPEGATTIDAYAFNKCSSLLYITLPDSITDIGRSAFTDCSSLTDVFYAGSETDWSQISIGANNGQLLGAAIHYNNTHEMDHLRKEWARQHMAYASSFEYSSMVQGAYRGGMLEVYHDMMDDDGIQLFEFADALVQASNGKLEGTDAELFELVLAELMYSRLDESLAYELYEENYYQAMVDVFDTIFQGASATADLVADGSVLKSMGELLDLLKTLKKNTPEFHATADKFTSLLKSNFTVDNLRDSILKGSAATGLGILFDGALEGYDTITDIVTYTQNCVAYSYTSDVFEEVMVDLSHKVAYDESLRFPDMTVSDQETNRAALAAALDSFTDSLRAAKKDKAAEVARYAVDRIQEGGDNFATGTMTTIALFGVKSIIACIPVLGQIQTAISVLSIGLSAAKLLTNIDEQAYRLDMVKKLYCVTAALDSVAQDYANELHEGSYHKACLFDESINLYKATQLMALEYMVAYENVLLADANSHTGSAVPIPGLMKAINEYSSKIRSLEGKRNEIQNILCHESWLFGDMIVDQITPVFVNADVYFIACPVSVTVLSETGEEIARLSDDACQVAPGYELYYHTVELDNGEIAKIAFIPEGYQVRIHGEDVGTMDVFILDSRKQLQYYLDIPVAEDVEGTFVPAADDADTTKLQMDDSVYTPEILSTQLGDVNGDDVIDTTDAYLIVLYYNERMELDDTQLAAADVNNDGSVDTTDAYYIVLFYNEKIDSFPT